MQYYFSQLGGETQYGGVGWAIKWQSGKPDGCPNESLYRYYSQAQLARFDENVTVL